MMFFWSWLSLLCLAGFAAQYAEKKAAMRGSHRKPLNPIVDKMLRIIFLMLLVFPLMLVSTWAIIPILFYLPSYLDGTEKKFGRPSVNVKNWKFWHIFKRRFDLSIVVTKPLDPKRQYVMGFHPHGVLPFCATFNLASEVNQVSKVLGGIKFRFLAASMCFFIPGYRDLILSAGVCDAARYVAQNLLDSGYSIMLCPGGATEALYCAEDVDTLVLKKRKGFISLAMRSGAWLVPIFTFNECRTYKVVDSSSPWLNALRKKFQAIMGISLPLVKNIVPRRTKATTVIGEAIPVEKNEHPTDKDIDKVLGQYIEALTKLYNENHDKYVTDRPKNLVIL